MLEPFVGLSSGVVGICAFRMGCVRHRGCAGLTVTREPRVVVTKRDAITYWALRNQIMDYTFFAWHVSIHSRSNRLKLTEKRMATENLKTQEAQSHGQDVSMQMH